MTSGIQYRLLTVADVEIFRELRLRGCKEEPGAFMPAYKELVDQPIEYFERRFENGWIAGAFLDSKLVGKAGLFREQGIKIQHKGTLWGVYVIPEARGRGIGKHCIEMVLQEAEQAGVEQVLATTDVQNIFTVALYKSLGFEPWGIERHAMKLPDRYVNEVVMTKFFKATP